MAQKDKNEFVSNAVRVIKISRNLSRYAERGSEAGKATQKEDKVKQVIRKDKQQEGKKTEAGKQIGR